MIARVFVIVFVLVCALAYGEAVPSTGEYIPICGNKSIWEADPIEYRVGRWLFEGEPLELSKREGFCEMMLYIAKEIVDKSPNVAKEIVDFVEYILTAKAPNLENNADMVDFVLVRSFSQCFADEAAHPDALAYVHERRKVESHVRVSNMIDEMMNKLIYRTNRYVVPCPKDRPDICQENKV